MEKKKYKRKNPESWNEYQHRYREEHPEKVKQWRENYFRKQLAKLEAERTKEESK